MSRGFVSFVLGLTICAVLLATGCGGGDSAPSKAGFLKEGNAICVKGEREQQKILQVLTRKYGLHASSSTKEKAFLEFLPPYEHASHELSELEPPAGDQDSFDKIIKAREKAAAEAKADPGTAITGKTQFKQADELAKAYGLTRCVA